MYEYRMLLCPGFNLFLFSGCSRVEGLDLRAYKSLLFGVPDFKPCAFSNRSSTSRHVLDNVTVIHFQQDEHQHDSLEHTARYRQRIVISGLLLGSGVFNDRP